MQMKKNEHVNSRTVPHADPAQEAGLHTVFICLLLGLALLQAGGFHTYVSAELTILLSVMVLRQAVKNKVLYLEKSLFAAGLLLLCVWQFAVCLYAVDPSMAMKGGVKFLPVGLFYLYLLQTDRRVSARVTGVHPFFGAASVLLSLGLIAAGVMKDRLLVDGRLAGFFEYPNTFAAFLLVCLVLSLYGALAGERERLPEIAGPGGAAVLKSLYGICALLCLLGVALTGSRTVYVLTAVFLAFFMGKTLARLLFKTNAEKASGQPPAFDGGSRQDDDRTFRRLIAVLAALVGVFALLLAAVLLFTDAGSSTLRRIMMIPGGSSTLLGRFLYVKDAFAILRDHLAGMGFYGYRFIQSAYKTGVYTVVNVHNELMQTALDVGIIPAILLAAGILTAVFSRKTAAAARAAMCLLLLHSLFDYDFQFMSVCMVFLLLVPRREEKVFGVRTAGAGIAAAACLLLLVCGISARTGMSDRLYVFRDFEGSEKIWPNTLAEMNLLTEETDAGKREELADRMMKRNAYASAGYAAAAQLCFGRGDIESMALYQKAAIRTDPYRYALYTDYLKMLYQSARGYFRQADYRDARRCADFANEIPQMLDGLEKRTSVLGRSISVQPVTSLDEENQKLLDEMKNY